MSTETVKLAAVFGSHMVLQRGIRAAVWGWAQPGETITVSVAGKKARTVTKPDGKWLARLPSLEAGGPHELTVKGKESRIVLQDVMVGEVWLASGQSNMELPLTCAADAEREIAAAQWPNIRLFSVAKNAVVEPQADVAGEWQVCGPRTVDTFSAVAYFFGRDLHRALNVPVGLINSSWGGTLAEVWTSREALMASPGLRPMVESYERELPEFDKRMAEFKIRLETAVNLGYPADPGNVGFDQGCADPATVVTDWPTMDVPRIWQRDGLNFSGVIWFRKEVDIPAEWAGRDLTLRLAPCDKHDITYFNNVQVGGIGPENPNAWCTRRIYTVPGHLVKPGRNVMATRIYSYAYAGGFVGSRVDMRLALAEDREGANAIAIDGDWQYKVEHNFGVVQPVNANQPLGPGNPNSPYSLYRGMIEPLVPFGLRGAIWYQGESNADRAYEYRTLFQTLIRSWRKAWGGDPLWFLFVQLANYMATDCRPGESTWAELREAQTLALRLPRTGMATIIDIGDASDIHPSNKQDVGRRLAQWALSQTYGDTTVVQSGPLFESAQVEPGGIRLRFAYTDGGLVAKDGALKGFAVAGRNRKFVWGEAKIDGDTVIVSSPEVKHPVAVRYAWSDNPVCNLYNAAGLPASPFRTDRWPGLTQPKKKQGSV